MLCKVHTHCFPGARVLDVSAQIPAILKDDESVAAVGIDAGVNDTKPRQTETLFWERPRLFRADDLHPSRVRAELLSDNISKTLRSI